MSEETSINPRGISFFGALAIVFITLKLVGVINWSWWWVLAPLWGPLTIFVIALLFVFVVFVLAQYAKNQVIRK